MSGGALVAQPAYRRFLKDMVDPRGVIPAGVLERPQMAALEKERQWLVQVLEEARRPSAVRQMTDQEYVDARAKALREGTEAPPQPQTQAATDAQHQRSARDVRAAEQALLALADDICNTVREHPAFEKEERAKTAALRAHAADLRRQADAAEREADKAGCIVQWLERVAADELYVVTAST